MPPSEGGKFPKLPLRFRDGEDGQLRLHHSQVLLQSGIVRGKL